MDNFKFTTNFLTRKSGLKIDGNRVLKNKYDYVDMSFADSEKPVVLCKENKKSDYQIYNMEGQRIFTTNNIKVHSNKYQLDVWDGYEVVTSSNYRTKIVGLEYVDGNGFFNLHMNHKVYSTERDYKRIEPLYKSDATTFLAIKKNNSFEIISSSSYSSSKPSLDLQHIKEQNPYLFTMVECRRPQNTYWVGMPKLEDFTQVIDNYFLNLAQNCTTKEDLKNLQKEKINCINKIEENFKNEEHSNLNKIPEYTNNIMKSKEELAKIEEASKITTKSFYWEKNHQENIINDNQLELDFAEAFNKMTNDFSKYVENQKSNINQINNTKDNLAINTLNANDENMM